MSEKISLPVRNDFGLNRTVCGCKECTVNCMFIPGYLVPDDLTRLAPKGTESEILTWAETRLLASPGAKMGWMIDGSMQTFRVPTLVPARKPGQRECIWLDSSRHCQVHANAPFGCAFFDAHMPDKEGTRRSLMGLQAILLDFQTDGLYCRVWAHLHLRDLNAPEPKELREAMKKHWRETEGKKL